MGNESRVTATPTIAEKCGLKYKEVDGLYYPVFGQSEPQSYAGLGKYRHRYLRVLMENDRYLYNKYFMQGVLFDKAAEYETYAWDLYDRIVQGINKVRGNDLDTLRKKDFQVAYQEILQVTQTVEEIVNEDLFASIDYNKRMRLERAKEDIAFEQTKVQGMEV